jgi:hypothetical protein
MARPGQRPAPRPRPADLEQDIYEAFVTGDGHHHPVDQLCENWLNLARQAGIAVDDEHGDLRPDVLDAITHTISAAIWFGLTTGYLTLTGSYHIPASSYPVTRPGRSPGHAHAQHHSPFPQRFTRYHRTGHARTRHRPPAQPPGQLHKDHSAGQNMLMPPKMRRAINCSNPYPPARTVS